MTFKLARFTSLDSVPESLRELATEVEGEFVVEIPEDRSVLVVDKALWDARHKSISERDAEVKRLKGEKKGAMDQFETLRAEHEELRSRLDSLGDDADIEKKIKAASDQRIQQIAKQKELEVQAAKAEAERASSEAQAAATAHERDLIWAEVFSGLTAAKAYDADLLAPQLMRDVRVKRDEDGQIVRGADGRAQLEVVKDGVVQVTGDGSPKPVREWIKGDVVSAHPMQFEGAGIAGGGARGGGRGGSSATVNPLKSNDMLEFARISKTNPALAKQFAAEVNYKPPA